MSKAADLANLIGNINAGGGGVNRNVIINGAMNVAQRGTSFTLENNSAKFPVDRFFVQDVNSSSGEATVSQSTTAPTDFKNSLKVDVTTADTALAANDQYKIEHRIEGQNIKHFNFGTSSAKTLALSFYIRSNKTGNTSVALLNNGNDRAYVATFTIDSANTWERKKITIEGDSSGTWLDTNGIGLRLRWGSFGSTYQTSSVNQWVGSQVMSTDSSPINFFDSTDNELYLTGVQLEVGQNATEFEHEPIDVTEKKCFRYYSQDETSGRIGICGNSGATVHDHDLIAPMRATPSVSLSETNIRIGDMVSAGFETSSGTIVLQTYKSRFSVSYTYGGFSGLTTYRAYLQEPRSGVLGFIKMDAEL